MTTSGGPRPPVTFLDALRAIVGTTHVLTDADAIAGHAVDWTGRFRGDPLAVVRPADTYEVSAVVRACAAAGMKVDVRAEQDVTGAFLQVEREHGPVEVAVFNAGAQHRKPLLEITADQFEKVWRLGEKGRIAFVAEWLNVTLRKEAVNVDCNASGSFQQAITSTTDCTFDAIGPITIPSLAVSVLTPGRGA